MDLKSIPVIRMLEKQLKYYGLLIAVVIHFFIQTASDNLFSNISVLILTYFFIIEKKYYLQYISAITMIVMVSLERSFSLEGFIKIFSLYGLIMIVQLLLENKKFTIRNFQLNVFPQRINYHGRCRRKVRIIILIPILLIQFGIGVSIVFAIQIAVLVTAIVELVFYIIYKTINRYGKIQLTVQQEIINLQPKFCIYFTAPRGSYYHVMMWLEYIERIGLPFFILCREYWHLEDFKGRTNVPIVVAPRITDLDKYLPESLKTIFYTNNSIKNCQMVRFWYYTHIQLLHGESDKPSSHNPVTNMFDYVFVAGQAAIDRYLNHGVKINEEKFQIVGRPQLSKIEIIQKREEKVLLYAPTWVGFSDDANYCSLPFAFEIIQAAVGLGYAIIFRYHPYSMKDRTSKNYIDVINTFLQKDTDENRRNHIHSDKATRELSVIDCINLSSAMISDNSSVIVDYLYSEKPFALVDVMNLGDRMEEVLPIVKGGYRIDPGLDELKVLLEKQLIVDPKREDRLEVKKYYLGDIPHNEYADKFVVTARSLIEEKSMM